MLGRKPHALVAATIQKHWRGFFQRKFGQLVWHKLLLLEQRHRAAVRLQRIIRVNATRRQILHRTREEAADRALSIIARILRTHSRVRKAKR